MLFVFNFCHCSLSHLVRAGSVAFIEFYSFFCGHCIWIKLALGPLLCPLCQCRLKSTNAFDWTGVQIVEICVQTREHNGGLIDLQELHRLLCQRRTASRDQVSEDDCTRAIKKLEVELTAGFFLFL